MRKVTKEDLKVGLEVRWYEHGRKYIIESVDENNVELSGYSKNTVPVDSVLENCYVPKSKVMRYTGGGYKNLTNSKNYNVEEGGTGYYHLIDNDGVKVAVIKSLFEEPSLQRGHMKQFSGKIDLGAIPQMQSRSVFAQIRCRGRSQKAIDALNAEKENVKLTPLSMERCELVGVKYDQDKLKPTLLLNDMPLAIQEVLKVLRFGAKKYSEGNWLEVNNGIERYRNASLRHALAQDEYDEESGLLHLAHEATSVLMLLELKLKEKQDAK